MHEFDETDDSVWQQALNWVLTLHALPGNAELEENLAKWLKEDPSHLATYEKAAFMWKLGGDLETLKNSQAHVTERLSKQPKSNAAIQDTEPFGPKSRARMAIRACLRVARMTIENIRRLNSDKIL